MADQNTKTKQLRRIEDLTPDARNANKGTARGRSLLEDSLRRYGAGRSILADKHGNLIAGNKTAEVAAELGLAIRTIETDGNELVVVQRNDLDLNTDEAARMLGYADNRVGEVSLDWDLDQIQQDVDAGVDLAPFFTNADLDELLAELAVPTFLPVGEDEQGRLDQKAQCTCPACGEVFTP